MKKFTLILFGILIFFNTFPQTKRYVAKNGNDSNPGTFAQPWQNIQKAATFALPGDTVFIRQGNYFEQVNVNVNGTINNYITFINYQNENVVIDGGNFNTLTTNLFLITSKNYIRIVGLKFENTKSATSTGIFVNGNSSFIEIKKNKFSNINFSGIPIPTIICNLHNASPILIWGQNPITPTSNILIDSNEVFNSRLGCSEGITVNGNVEGFTISNNYVHNLTNIGLDFAGGYGKSSNPANDFARNGSVFGNIVDSCISPIAAASCIYVDGGKNINIFNNKVSRCSRGFVISPENNVVSENIIIRDNLSFNNLESGISIGQPSPSTSFVRVKNCQIYSNTTFGNFTLNTGGHGEFGIYLNSNCSFRNNIFFATNNDNRVGYIHNNYLNDTLNHNLYYSKTGNIAFNHNSGFSNTYSGSLSDFISTTSFDQNSTIGDPKFSDTSNRDFKLTNSSAAINKGNPSYNPNSTIKDFYGGARKFDSNPVDCGADEFEGTLSTGISSNDRNLITINFYPNPVTTFGYLKNIDFKIKNIQIFNSVGQIIKKVKINGNSTTEISLKNLVNGEYLIIAFDKNNKIIGKNSFIKI